MFKKISSADGTLISYQHDESGEMFRRFMGGLCMSSGFVFIVGEELFEPGGSGFRPLKVLYEGRESSLHELVKQAGTLQSLYPLREWLADQEDAQAAQAHLFGEFSATLGLNLNLFQPSLVLDLRPALQILRRRFKQRSLFVPKKGILAAKLELVNQADEKEPGLEEKYPEVLILASAVHEFDISSKEPSKFKPRRPPSAMAA